MLKIPSSIFLSKTKGQRYGGEKREEARRRIPVSSFFPSHCLSLGVLLHDDGERFISVAQASIATVQAQIEGTSTNRKELPTCSAAPYNEFNVPYLFVRRLVTIMFIILLWKATA
jgi:hypothetical protein